VGKGAPEPLQMHRARFGTPPTELSHFGLRLVRLWILKRSPLMQPQADVQARWHR
jgi:hypothetical protein